VTLKRVGDGKIITIPLDKLIAADREAAQKQAK
jgi:hypothetical protein